MDAIEQVSRDDVSETYVVELCIGRCADELVITYRKILKSFYDANYTAHLDELETLYCAVNDQNVDPGDVVSSIDDILRMAGDRALGFMQIGLDPDTPIDVYAEILDILLGFDPTDTPDILLHAIENSEDSVDALAQLLELLGTYEAEALHQYIARVGGDFVPNIKRLLNDNISVQTTVEVGETPTDVSMEQRRRLARLVARKPETLGSELGRIGSGLGASMESLYGVHVGTLLDGSMESAIEHLYSLAALSCESFEAAEKGVGACLDDLYYEVDSRRRAEQARVKIASDYRTIYGEHHG